MELVLSVLNHSKLSSTLLLLALVLLLRSILVRTVRSLDLKNGQRRRWLVRIRSGVIVLMAASLLTIWAEQLHAIAVSLLAIAVALVVATKELILCVCGSGVRAAGRMYEIGDRIEIKDVRGWVIDHNMLTTTVLEVGPGHASQLQTGCAVSIPNSLLLDTPVRNESYLDEVGFHVFTVPMHLSDDWRRARDLLLQISTQACQPYQTKVREYLGRLRSRSGLDVPSVPIRVRIQLPEPDRIEVLVRICVPADQRGVVEQEILERFLDAWQPRSGRGSDVPSRAESRQEQSEAPSGAVIDC